jgi:hypothetical protein
MEGQIAHRPAQLIVDLAGLSFLGDSGISELVSRAHASGYGLHPAYCDLSWTTPCARNGAGLAAACRGGPGHHLLSVRGGGMAAASRARAMYACRATSPMIRSASRDQRSACSWSGVAW